MTFLTSARTSKMFSMKALAWAIAAACVSSANAAPTGGAVVDGDGSITQAGTDTTINQSSDRLSLQWDTFNVAANERVQFIQPSSEAVALNRILDNSGSQILGRIDANGRIILMNPNGIIFGKDATLNVGSLVASGLNINSADFMNGELVFSEVAGSQGAVINRGIINAATGGNVALIGKTVANHNLISANLGHIALVSGSQAVVTFDDAGLIGVRIDKETLASEVGTAYAVRNAGTLQAEGGKILLNASVSADLFSEAVNHGELNGSTDVVMHDDGSFTLGAGNNVINTGVVDVSTGESSSADAGYVVLAGQNVEQRGAIRANAAGENLAGQIYAEAYDQVKMTGTSRIEANANVTSGKISLDAEQVVANTGAKTATTGNTVINSYLVTRLPELVTNHLYLSSIGSVRQVGAAKVNGHTHLHTAFEADMRLANSANDFNTLTVDARHVSNIAITESNDLVLGNLAIQDSNLNIHAVGADATISQAENSTLNVDSSSFKLQAANIDLGAGGGKTSVHQGTLNLFFAKSIATRGSITLIDDYQLKYNQARIVGENADTGRAVDLRGNYAIDLDAAIDNSGYSFVIDRMVGASAVLGGLTYTTQTGPINLSGTLTWNSLSATLDNPENDVAAIQGSGGIAFKRLVFVDKNDLLVRSIETRSEVEINLSSIGEGATIRQAPNSKLKADLIYLSADNILVGAKGTSSISATYILNFDFSDQLHINGPWTTGPFEAHSLRILGDDGDNRLTFGEHAINPSFAGAGAGDYWMGSVNIDLKDGNDTVVFDIDLPTGTSQWGNVEFDLGAGDDRVHMNRSVNIPVTLGLGRDIIRIWDMETHYEATDFDSGEDVVIIYN